MIFLIVMNGFARRVNRRRRRIGNGIVVDTIVDADDFGMDVVVPLMIVAFVAALGIAAIGCAMLFIVVVNGGRVIFWTILGWMIGGGSEWREVFLPLGTTLTARMA